MDERYMWAAIETAKEALLSGDVPIGAVIVRGEQIIARACNRKELTRTATRHAELEAIEQASRVLGDWRLNECALYVTLEPCHMCAGAIVNSRLGAVYFGAYDPKAGCCGSIYNLAADKNFNHRAAVQGGILLEECSSLLSGFFSVKRKNKKMDGGDV